LKLEAGDNAGFRTWLIYTIVLGLIFLSCTIYEYNHLIDEGFRFGTNAKSTAFYSITGFHASHVFIGLCIFLTALIPALSNKISHTFVKSAGVYWHFVDMIWFFVVSQIYFW
jgi:cytochrome c oxidase subunit 3